jgi:uridine kinase
MFRVRPFIQQLMLITYNSTIANMIEFIGLDGGQGSGKTTYSRSLISELQQRTSSPILYHETDDYLTEREWREPLSETFFELPANHRKLWNFKRMGHVLIKLQETEGHSLQIDGLYNRATGKRDRAVSFDVHDDSIMLVGGPYLLEPEFQGLFSRLIFLDVPEETRLGRVISRNIAEGKSEARAREVFRKFEHFYRPYWEGNLDAYDEVIRN